MSNKPSVSEVKLDDTLQKVSLKENKLKQKNLKGRQFFQNVDVWDFGI